MNIHQRTIVTLDDLAGSEWFSRCGKLDGDTYEGLNSWTEAIKSMQSNKWKNLKLEAANQFRERLMERSMQRYMLWNDIVETVKPYAVALVFDKTEKVMAGHDLPQSFLDTVKWDILHLCMEAEYGDVFGPSFYSGIAYWYKTGHFPCGWSGDFPAGKIIVF